MTVKDREKDWRLKPAEPLERLAEALGEGLPGWAEREELEVIRLPGAEVAGARIHALERERLEDLEAAYGKAVYYQFARGDDEMLLNSNQPLTPESFADFQSRVEPEESVRFTLHLDKARLAEIWFADLLAERESSSRAVLYLYPERLERFLNACSLELLEARLWRGHWDERMVFLVPGRDVCFYGPHLLALGGRFLFDPPESIREDRLTPAVEIERIRRACRDALKWQSTAELELTPLHLYGKECPESRDPLVHALRVHFLNAVLLYTADRSLEAGLSQGARSFRSTYSSTQQAIDIDHPTPERLGAERIGPAQCEALFELVKWVYDRQWKPNDRLTFVQLTIVDALRGASPVDRPALLVENAPAILRNIQWHWKAFVEGKIEGYWEQVRELERFIDETLQAYAGQIAQMVSRLTETVLAAVAVVLGSFLAALFRDTFDPRVFRIGMATYALYVLLFPLLYNMSHAWGSYRTLVEGFAARRERFEGRLPDGKVTEIVEHSSLEENRQRFERWFGWSVLIYLGLLASAVAAAYYIPQVFGG